MVALNIYCFGRFELAYQGKRLPRPATIKSQSLLAYLACNRLHPVSRDQLVNLFWGERPEHRARRSLSTALWHIRRCLPNEPFITADNQAVQFTGDVWLDIDAFNEYANSLELSELEKIISLYRGDFLDGFYDEWAINERYHLQSRYLEALRRLMIRYEEANRPQQALDTALRLLEQDPFQESANRTAMRSYTRLGQRNAALEHYHRYREIIRQELNIEPMPETVDLAEQIRSGHFLSGPVPAISLVASQPVKAASAYGLDNLPLPFFGRKAELARLHDLWQAQQSRLLLISGEAGVGKSRLVQEFIRQLPGTPVLYGRCYEYERLLPYQPFAEALRPLLVSFTTADWQQLPAWVGGELLRLLPELSEKLRGDYPTGLQPDRTRLFSAVSHLISLFARQQPQMLILEDLHWATESTLQLLHFLVRQLVPSLMLIGTYRREMVGPDHPLDGIRRQLGREKIAMIMELSRLSMQTVERIVTKVAGGKIKSELAGRLYNETEGNPFFLAEMIRSLFDTEAIVLVDGRWQSSPDTPESPLPANITEAILARLKRLPSVAQNVLRMAAVFGREFDFELLKAVSRKEDEAVLELIELWLRHFLIEEGTGIDGRDYAFSHHKIQEVLYADTPLRRQQQLHGRVAVALERLYSPEKIAGELAFHYLLGQRHDPALISKAVYYLQMAGEQAAAQYAHHEAVTYFSQALALLPKGDGVRLPLLLAREKVLDNLGNRVSQASDLEELDQLASQMDADTQTTIALRRANFAVVTGRYSEAIEFAQAAVASANTADLQTEAFIQWSLALYHQGQYESAVPRIQEALKTSRQAQLPRQEVRCLTVLGMVHWRQSRYPEAETAFKAALAIARRPEINDRVGQGNVLGNLGIIRRYQGSLLAARDYFQQALAVWQEMGHRRGQVLYLTNLGVVAMDTAEFAAAGDYLNQALAITREIGERETEQLILNNLCEIGIYQGDFQAALALAEAALLICQEIDSQHGKGVSFMNLGDVTQNLGRLAEAQSYYNQALDIRRRQGDQRGQGLALCGLGEVAGRQGDYQKAADFLRQALSIMQAIKNKAEECRVLVSLAGVLVKAGEVAEPAVYLEQALQLSRDLNQTWLESRAQCGLAALALARGDHQAAFNHGQTALDLARQIGAKALEAAAGAFLTT